MLFMDLCNKYRNKAIEILKECEAEGMTEREVDAFLAVLGDEARMAKTDKPFTMRKPDTEAPGKGK